MRTMIAISIEKIIDLTHTRPLQILSKSELINTGFINIELESYKFNSKNSISKTHWSPFDGYNLIGIIENNK